MYTVVFRDPATMSVSFYKNTAKLQSLQTAVHTATSVGGESREHTFTTSQTHVLIQTPVYRLSIHLNNTCCNSYFTDVYSTNARAADAKQCENDVEKFFHEIVTRSEKTWTAAILSAVTLQRDGTFSEVIRISICRRKCSTFANEG